MEAKSLKRAQGADHTCRYCHLEAFEEAILAGHAGTVVPSVGAMVEGWVLVFPARHVLSLSELTDSEWLDFGALVNQAQSSVEGTYGTTIQFEHGSAGEGRLAACGVDHAHLHIVPLVIDLREAIDGVDHGVSFSWKPVIGRVPRVGQYDYVYISDATGQWVSHHDWLPGQVVRRAIAGALDLVEWDWKVNARLSTVEATRARLRSA